MKALGAALIAVIVLYAADTEYNDGRYTQIIVQAASSIISR